VDATTGLPGGFRWENAGKAGEHVCEWKGGGLGTAIRLQGDVLLRAAGMAGIAGWGQVLEGMKTISKSSVCHNLALQS
jgi:hypothetical protein